MYLSFNLQPFGMMDVIHEFETPPKSHYHMLGGVLHPPQAHAPTPWGGVRPPPSSCANCWGEGVLVGLDAHPPLQALCDASFSARDHATDIAHT